MTLLPPHRASAWTIAAVLGALLLVAGALVRRALFDPDVSFLPRHDGAEWIVFPRAPSPFVRSGAEIEARFTRTFELAELPTAAQLTARLREQGQVRINGRVVAPHQFSDWKRGWRADVREFLTTGTNSIEVRAASDFGPASVWVALSCGSLELGTDASWSASCAGSAERPARLASAPMSAWAEPTSGSVLGEIRSGALNPSPAAGLRSCAPTLLACAVLAALAVALAGRCGVARTGSTSQRLVLVAAGSAAALTALLFVHNRRLAPEAGFDAPAHAQYVDYVLEHGAIPFADQGWEMYQPPLYYVAAALALEATGYERLDGESVHVVRALQWLALAAQILCVALSLRIVFHDRPRAALAGIAFGALVPMQLYLFQYTTNECFAATFVSASIYAALRIASREQARARDYAILGVVLGLAMLSKFSAALALVVISTVLGVRALVRRTATVGSVARSLGVMALSTLAVCAWYYAQVVERFGKLFVWNNDPASGLAWWQEPGVRTSGDYLRAGRVFAQPLLSAFHSTFDALYSTFWSDGMLGGSGRIDLRPPWDYELLSANVVLALLPTAALLIGATMMLARLVRTPTSADWMLLGIPVATCAALLGLTLDVPFFAQAKSVYASSVMVPLSAWAALGVDRLARVARRAEVAVWTGFTAVLLVGFAGFFSKSAWTNTALDESEAVVEGRRATQARAPSDAALSAIETAAAARVSFPDSAQALAQFATRLHTADRSEVAVEVARDAIAIDPWFSDAHYALGIALYKCKRLKEALEALGVAHDLAPSKLDVALDLASLLQRAERTAEAFSVLKRARANLVRNGEAVPARLEESIERLRTRAGMPASRE